MKKIWLTLSFLCLIIYFALAYFVYSFDQGFFGSNGHSFIGRTMPYIFSIAGTSLLILNSVWNTLKEKNIFMKRLILGLLIFLGTLPFPLLGIYLSLPTHAQNYFFEGVDENTCETGKKPLPWGRDYDIKVSAGKDFCYRDTLQCEKMSDEYSQKKNWCFLIKVSAGKDFCYRDTLQCEKMSDEYSQKKNWCFLDASRGNSSAFDSPINRTEKEYVDCDKYSDKDIKNDCYADIAELKHETSKCPSIDFEYAFQGHNCFVHTLPREDQQGYYELLDATSSSEAESICSKYSGQAKDICQVEIVSRFLGSGDKAIGKRCDEISDKYPWYKEICYKIAYQKVESKKSTILFPENCSEYQSDGVEKLCSAKAESEKKEFDQCKISAGEYSFKTYWCVLNSLKGWGREIRDEVLYLEKDGYVLLQNQVNDRGEFCSIKKGFAKDFCYATIDQITIQTRMSYPGSFDNITTSQCGLISSDVPWFKQNCYNFSKQVIGVK